MAKTSVDSAFEGGFSASMNPQGETNDHPFNIASTHGIIQPVKRCGLTPKPGRVEGAMSDMLAGANPAVDQYTSPVKTPVESSYEAPFGNRR